MRFSIVTISCNQGRFLRDCIDSVLGQDFDDIEYIVVDPGSTDGSRQIIASYSSRFRTVLESDSGPADGLNKGFALAAGDVLGYLNADDTLLPHALREVADFLTARPDVDVVRGHAEIIDANSVRKRYVFSDRFSLRALAYGACVSIQPSTFFRRAAYERAGGFNVENRSNWDGELLVDMALSGARVATMDGFLSCYRVHGASITGSGRLAEAHREYSARMFEKIKGRQPKRIDSAFAVGYRMANHLLNPRAALERVRRGPVYGSAAK